MTLVLDHLLAAYGALEDNPVATAELFSDIDAYMSAFAGPMADRVERTMVPLFDPIKQALSADVLDLRHGPKPPYPAQAVTIEGLARGLEQQSVVFCVGETGTGKTVIGAQLAKIMSARKGGRAMRVVITTPNQLVYKWRDHCLQLVPGCKAVVVRSYRDLLGMTKRPSRKQMEFWIIPRDRGKLSYSWRPAYTVKRRTQKVRIDDGRGGFTMQTFEVKQYCCPQCGQQIFYMDGDQAVPADKLYFWDRVRIKRSCEKCGERLWQAFNGNFGCTFSGGRIRRITKSDMPRPGIAPRRVSPAEYIWRRKIRFDLYLADEIHENAGEGTLQGAMFGSIARRSTSIVPLTGTLIGGYALNLLYLLWRTMPGRMVRDGQRYGDAGQREFIQLYGVLQIKKRYRKKDGSQNVQDLTLGRGRCVGSQERSLPGVSPLLFTKYLLPNAVFLRLMEMHENLPPFHEYVHKIPMSGEQSMALETLQKKFLDHAKQMKASGAPCRAWPAFRACSLRWPDRPWPTYTIYDVDKDGNRIEAVEVPELPSSVEYPKETRLRRLVKLQRLRGRRCWIFTEMTGVRWDVANRLSQMLEKHGLRTAILRTTQDGGPAPEDREDWIAKQTERGVDCIISNPHLVKTGLDLYDFPTIVFYYCGDSTNTMRQASRRAWRLGQTLPCEVHYFVYAASDKAEQWHKLLPDPFATPIPSARNYVCLQSAALALMAKKMEASLMLEGDFSGSGLAAMGDSDDIAGQLSRVIAGHLIVEDPKVAFARYRETLKRIMPSIDRAADPAGGATALPAPTSTARGSSAGVAPEVTPEVEAPESLPISVPKMGEASWGPDVSENAPAPAPAPRTHKPARASRGIAALIAQLEKDDPRTAQALRDELAKAGRRGR